MIVFLLMNISTVTVIHGPWSMLSSIMLNTVMLYVLNTLYKNCIVRLNIRIQLIPWLILPLPTTGNKLLVGHIDTYGLDYYMQITKIGLHGISFFSFQIF